jgi:hypothetical protein
MSRRADTTAIIAAARKQYEAILKDYDRALQDHRLDLRIPVKNQMSWGLPLYFTGDGPCRSITTEATSQGKHAVVK